MTHDIHLSFDNLTLQNTGVMVKRGDYETHTLNFIFDDVGADSYRIRIKNANGECKESDAFAEPSYTLSSFDVSCRGLVNAELSAYNGDTRITSATFTYEVLGDISTDNAVVDDDRFPILDTLLKKADSLASDADELREVLPEVKEIAENVAKNAENTQDIYENVKLSAENAKESEANAKVSEDNAKTSEGNARESETVASQALSDLLAMINTDIATLTDGKLTPSQIPSLSINDVFTVSSAEEMCALDAQRGDVAIFTYESNSISTEKPESMVKNTILVNETISGAETVDSLRDEGISFNVTPVSIVAITGMDVWGNNMDGVYWEGSSSPKTTYTNVLSGDYTINVSTKIDINQMHYFVNYKDGNNYYRLSLNYNGALTVTKVLNGVSYTLEPVGTAGAVNFHSRTCNAEINVECQSGGGLKITLTSADNVASHAKCSYEIVDDGKLYGEAIKEGYFIFVPSYCKMMSLYFLKIVKHEEYGQEISARLRDTYILASDDATNLDNWVKLGISYVEYSGNSAYAENANSAYTINGHRLVEMSEADFKKAVKDPNTYYLVY